MFVLCRPQLGEWWTCSRRNVAAAAGAVRHAPHHRVLACVSPQVRPPPLCPAECRAPCISRSKEEKADPELYAENVRHRMALALGVPASQLSQDDVALTMRAAARKYPVDHATLGVFQFRKLGIKPKHLLPLVDAFIDLDTAQRGTIPAREVLAGRHGEEPASPLLAALVAGFAGRGGMMDMHAWMLLHILLSGRAPGGWDGTCAALREAAEEGAGGADGFLHALCDASNSSRGNVWDGFRHWVESNQGAWRQLVQTWLPSGTAMDSIWADE